MDFFAIASWGFYPTPGVTMAQRAAYFVTRGLWGGPLPETVPSSGVSWIGRAFSTLYLNAKIFKNKLLDLLT